jgi:hypothetical protein
MKFHIPFTSNATERQNVYEGIRQSLRHYLQARPSSTRIRRLEYMDRGRAVEAEVGYPFSEDDETVMAIFHDPQRDRFYICTMSHGVLHGRPHIVAGHTVKMMREFVR